MKLKPVTILAIIVIIFSIAWISFQKKESLKSASNIAEPALVTPTPSPESTPGRPLKPNEKYVGSMGLYITAPEGMRFRQDPDSEIAVNFYIEAGPTDNPTYQFYVVYQPNKAMTEEGLKLVKREMNQTSIKEASVGSYKGFEGLIMGPKTRYNTFILKNGHPLTFSTIPPTEENKAITDQILSTVSFE